MGEVLATVGAIVDSSAINRAIAKRALECVDREQAFSASQVASMANWLMASLLAINGGGALATVNASKEAHGLWIAGAIFALGVGFALMSAVRMQDTYNASVLSLSQQGQYWAGVAIYGQRDAGHEKQDREKAARIQRWAFLPPTLGWCSGILFIAGTVLLVAAIQSGRDVSDHRCAAIEQEMLTNLAKRPSDVSLFTALGCTPT